VLLHCWLGHLTCKIVSEITYNVSSGTLNPTITYYTVQAKVREGSPEGRSGTTGDRICETGRLSQEWKREGVMDEQSGETDEGEVIGEVVGESELEELVTEWGWRRDKGSWFQRHGEAYRKERSVILREDDVGSRARVTTDEERVVRGQWIEMRLWRYGGWEIVRTL